MGDEVSAKEIKRERKPKKVFVIFETKILLLLLLLRPSMFV